MCRPAKIDIPTTGYVAKTALSTSRPGFVLYANVKHFFFEPVESGHVSLKHNTSFKNKLQVQVKLTVLPQSL